MKTKTTLFLTLFTLFAITSCRKDEYRFEQSPDGEPLKKETVVSNLVTRTVLHDGSIDNIIDRASCFTVKLPVEVVANGNQITINSTDDYNTIEAIFNESDSDTDTLEIMFPVSIILEDFTEIAVGSVSEFNDYRAKCFGENEEDDDIECIDFNYPISVTTYNTITDELKTKYIDSDHELYEFIEAIEEYLVVNINFPITLTLYDGTFISINNLDELESAIENVVNACDEDDDYDYDDDDEYDATSEEFADLLEQCPLTIYEFEINDEHQESQFEGFVFEFNFDGDATATNASGTVYNGVWAVSSNDYGLRLTIQFNDFSTLSHTWRVEEINSEDSGTEIKLRYSEAELKLKQNCS